MKQQQAKGSGMKRLALSVTFLASSLAPLTTYGADGVLRGRVTDKADGEGVVGAAVSIAGTNIATATDIDGNFVLRNVPASKQQKVTVTSIGYAPTTQVINLGDGQTATLNFALGQTTIMASEVVVGAALYKQDRLDIPVTANVVSKDDIKKAPNPTLDKVVEAVPGVVVNRAGGVATSTLQIRGSNTFQGGAIGTRVNAFYDGFPINSPESGEIVWQTVNMNAADKVEILKGAAATLYGSGAMGGVVNVSGHSPDKLEIKAGSSIGFYDAPPSSDQSLYRKDYTPVFWNTYAGVGNKSGKWTYDLLYSHSDDDGYRQNAWNYMNDIKFKARYDIDSKQYLQLSSFYNSTVGGYAYQWAFNTNAGAYGPPPPVITFSPIANHSYDVFRTFTSNSPAYVPGVWQSTYDIYTDDTIKRKNALVGLNYVNLLSDELSLDTKLYYTYNSSRIEYNTTNAPQQYPTGGGYLTSIGFGFLDMPMAPSIRIPGQFNETDSDRYGAGAKLDWRASDNHRLLFGLDANIVDVNTTQVAAEAPTPNTFNAIQEKNFAAFLQDEWNINDKLTALMSVRYDWSGIDADRAQSAGTTYVFSNGTWVSAPGAWVTLNNKSVSAISPRVALNYKATDDMAFRASWGRSFRAPTLYERFVRDGGIFTGIINPDLDKETMTAWELGVYKQFSDKLSIDVAGFINDYHDLIQSRIYGSSTFRYENITEARIAGIETSLNYKPTSDWSINGAYTWLYARNRSFNPATATSIELANPDPRWLPYRPEHTISAGVNWKATKKLAINVNGRYVSKYKNISQYSNPQGLNYPGDFVVFNAGLKYQFSKNVTGTIVCNNINNTQYQEAEWFMAPNRSFIAGIDLKY